MSSWTARLNHARSYPDENLGSSLAVSVTDAVPIVLDRRRTIPRLRANMMDKLSDLASAIAEIICNDSVVLGACLEGNIPFCAT
jgi:hypothetical protein